MGQRFAKTATENLHCVHVGSKIPFTGKEIFSAKTSLTTIERLILTTMPECSTNWFSLCGKHVSSEAFLMLARTCFLRCVFYVYFFDVCNNVYPHTVANMLDKYATLLELWWVIC